MDTRGTPAYAASAVLVADDIDVEDHPHDDQFLRLEQGKARVLMGSVEDDLDYEEEVGDDWLIFVPEGMWHNVTNIGDDDMKTYAIYGPGYHEHGTVYITEVPKDADRIHVRFPKPMAPRSPTCNAIPYWQREWAPPSSMKTKPPAFGQHRPRPHRT